MQMLRLERPRPECDLGGGEHGDLEGGLGQTVGLRDELAGPVARVPDLGLGDVERALVVDGGDSLPRDPPVGGDLAGIGT